jgi:hypothetical protein
LFFCLELSALPLRSLRLGGSWVLQISYRRDAENAKEAQRSKARFEVQKDGSRNGLIRKNS